MGDPVYITAQEAAERLMTIRIAGWLLFFIVVLGGMWLIIRWKYSEDRRRIEAQNERDRISVTNNIGMAVTNALKEDGNWKEQFIILKSKYEVLEAHCENMEKLLDSAKGSNGFNPQEA